MNLGRRTALSLAWSLLSLPCVAVVSLVVVPLYVARLGKGAYGTVLLAQQVAAAAAALVPNPAEALIQRLAASFGARNRPRMKDVLGTGLRAMAVAAGATLLLGALVLALALAVPLATAQTMRVVAVFLAALSVRMLADAFLGILSALQRPTFVGAASTLSGVAGPLLGILLVEALGGYGIPAATGTVAAALALATYLRVRSVDAELVVGLPPFSGEVFRRDLWPLARARWLAVIPTTWGPGSDRVVAGVTSRSSTLVTSFALTGRLPDLLATIIPSAAGAAVPALAYASDAKGRDPVGAARDLLALVVGVAAGASLASLAVLEPFLALWVPSVTPLGRAARGALCLALFGRAFGAAGAAVLNGFGRNQALPRLSWLNAIATIAAGATGGLAAGVDGVAVGFGMVALFALTPLMVRALAAEKIIDGPTGGRFARVAIGCGLAGFLGARAVFVVSGIEARWSALGTAMAAGAISTAVALLSLDPASRTRLAGLLRRGTVRG